MADLVAVVELREDFALYPREKVSPTNVQALRDALNLGAEFPAVVVWRKTRAIIDGFHRVRAVRMEKGDYGEVAVEWRDYESKAEAFAEAVRLNASHGLRLGAEDFERIMQRARHFGLKPSQVSTVLKVPMQRLEKRAPTSSYGSALVSPSVRVKALKETARHSEHLSSAVDDLAERLQNHTEAGPGQLPAVMTRIKRARDSRDQAELRDSLLNAAALFLWWAARTTLPIQTEAA